MNRYKCTTGNMSTVSARAPVILLFLIISSKESQELSGSSNTFICIWTATTCIKYMFLMVYFIPPKSNGSVYVKTIPFPPIRTSLHWGGLFSDAVICWLNCKKVRKQALPTQIQLKRLNYYYYYYYYYYHYLNLQPSCIYASTHLLMFFFHLFMKKYQNLGRINKSWKGTSRLWENR